MKRGRKRKEEIAEDFCFICKDGGLLVVCEYMNCLKAYHPECVGKDSTLLETNDRWICSWHSCFICHKVSKYQCFCCPISVCQACIRAAEFVHVKKKKGFCNDCLKLALLIEENVDVDSDGGKVDFKDTETYEFLFKDYWEIINGEERLSLEDLRTANALLKKDDNNADVFSSDEQIKDEVELVSDVDDMDNNDGMPLEDFKRHVQMKAMKKTYQSRKEEFTGWGSKELLHFLTSIGKSTDKPISQFEVYDIITDYIQENKLLHPQRKKKVICDARLHSLFRRKSVNRLKISDLLEAHFPQNQIPEDNSTYRSEDKNFAVSCKRQRRSMSDGKTCKLVPNNIKDKALEVPKKCYASITTKNIKLVYLRRSLIEEFLKNPDTFDSKVIDCFVRVKCDLKDYPSTRSFFQLMQVTAINRALEAYKTGKISTNIFLLVSDMNKDIRICMLSDDDFAEEECEDLRQRVKQGLLKRPTIAELDEKARSLHEDITNHWIDREIMMLQKLIDRANEKGWRRELYEYIERRERLQTPSERVRLLKEIPKVIADAEIELEATPNSLDDEERVKEGKEDSPNQRDSDGKNEGTRAASHQNAGNKETKGIADAINERAGEGEVEGIGAAPIVSGRHEKDEPQQPTVISECKTENAVIDLDDYQELGISKKMDLAI